MTDHYKQLSIREHVYQRPNMYAGSADRVPSQQWVFEDVAGEGADGVGSSRAPLHRATVEMPQAMAQVILEVIANAGDNVARSRRRGLDPGVIEIRMTERELTVINGGAPIPLTKHSSGLWNPTLIFSVPLTSSNYEGTRTEGGMNGYGAKLTNIFSSRFEVVVGDAERRRQFQQVWTDNMRRSTEPVVAEYEGPNFVRVQFVLDFQRFGYPEARFEPADYALVYRQALDCALTSGTTVVFNGRRLTVDLPNYARCLFPPGAEFPRALEVQTGALRAVVVDTPDAGQQLSFVNGIPTPDGGVHVDAVHEEFKRALLKHLDGALKQANERLRKINGRKVSVSLEEVRHHLTVVVVAQLKDPQYEGQMKSRVAGPKVKCPLSADQKAQLKSWSVVDRLVKMLESKVGHLIPKTARKSKYLKGDVKCEDANWAGSAKSEECLLCLVEGLSASAYPSRLFEHRLGANFRDRVGILPLQGKLLNTMNTEEVVTLNNKVIKRINTVMGLDPTLDYRQPEDLKRLRYGYLLILSDADVDGKHITGLVVNYLLTRFPGLAEHGRLLSRRTPIVRVVHRRTKAATKFYTLQQFTDWRRTADTSLYYPPEYFKGLASSSPGEIASDAQDETDFVFRLDEASEQFLRLAFDDRLADQRKEWIQAYDPTTQTPSLAREVSVSQFINTELIEFSLDDLRRSIPSEVDGLKVSQRKILEAAFRHWGSKSGSRLLQSELGRYKTGQMANYASEQTNYVHGEKCLATTLAKMAQVFVGTNNLPLFQLDSEFGTRNQGGKDAGDARYTYTRPMPYLEQLFPKVDFPLLDQQYDENRRIEPKFFLPIVPLHVINGALGIGTGHSCFIPKYHPVQVIDWYLQRLRGRPLPRLKPWYRGFTGTVELIGDQLPEPDLELNEGTEDVVGDAEGAGSGANDVGSGADEARVDDPELEAAAEARLAKLPSRPGYARFLTVGTFSVDGRGTITITELPVGRWSNDYYRWLLDLRTKKMVRDVVNRCTAEKVRFELKGFAKKPTPQSLRLTRSYPMSNMVLLDPDYRPVHFPSIDQLLERFANLRLGYYARRREYLLSGLRDRLGELASRRRFIAAKLSGQLVLENRTRDEVRADLVRLGLEEKWLTTVKLYQLTREGLADLDAELAKVEAEIQGLESTSPIDLWLTDLTALRQVLVKRPEFQ